MARSVNSEASLHLRIGVFWEMWIFVSEKNKLKWGYLNDTSVVSSNVLALTLGDCPGIVTLNYPQGTEELYARFREEVAAAIDFRLRNPGGWGERDGKVMDALRKCLSLL